MDHMLKVLKQLQKKSFLLDINKYEFFVTKVKYLRLIVILKSIYIDLKKIQAIIDWKLSITIKDIQTFMRFARFYK